MNESLKNISTLKTTRSANFHSRKISEDDFNSILQASIKAPNASNRQSYSIIILNDEQKQLLGLKGDKVLLYIVDFHRHERLKELLGKKISFRHFQPFLTGVIDVSLAIQNAAIAANSLNIGYLITNDSYTKDLEKLYNLFNIPQKGCFPLLYLCLGYIKDEVLEMKSRLDINHIVHQGKYKEYSEDNILSIIKKYNEPNMELYKNWKELGYSTYLDWFYEKWLPALEKKEKSDKLVEIIRNIGFLD